MSGKTTKLWRSSSSVCAPGLIGAAIVHGAAARVERDSRERSSAMIGAHKKLNRL
jgi:hypothetical protein